MIGELRSGHLVQEAVAAVFALLLEEGPQEGLGRQGHFQQEPQSARPCC